MLKITLIAIGGGILSALASMAFLGNTPFAMGFVYLAPVPLYLVGFSQGDRAAAIASLAGFIIAGLVGGQMMAGVFGLVHAFPAWIIARQSMRVRPDGSWYPQGRVLTILTIYGVSLLVIAGIALSGNDVGTENTEVINIGDNSYQSMISGELNNSFEILASGMTASDRSKIVNMISPLFLGMMASSWILMTIINAVIAQGIVVRANRNLRPSPKYIDLVVPLELSWLLVLAATAALAGSILGMDDLGYLGRNIAMVFAVPYFLGGLAVVHGLAKEVSFSGILLGTFYLIIIVSGWALVVVVGIGVVEQWIGLRGRFTKNDSH